MSRYINEVQAGENYQESISCRVSFTYDMHQKNLFLVTSIFRTRPWIFEIKF